MKKYLKPDKKITFCRADKKGSYYLAGNAPKFYIVHVIHCLGKMAKTT